MNVSKLTVCISENMSMIKSNYVKKKIIFLFFFLLLLLGK